MKTVEIPKEQEERLAKSPWARKSRGENLDPSPPLPVIAVPEKEPEPAIEIPEETYEPTNVATYEHTEIVTNVHTDIPTQIPPYIPIKGDRDIPTNTGIPLAMHVAMENLHNFAPRDKKGYYSKKNIIKRALHRE